MRKITEEESKEILYPYVSKIRNAVKRSVDQYFTGPELASIRFLFSKRSDASNCHDLIVNSIINEFDGIPRTRCYYRNNLFLLTVNERIVLRFKMFDQNLMSHGIETKQLTLFNYQQVEQLELPDMPPNGLLYVGYRLNSLRTAAEEVYITCRFGDNNLWNWNITDEETSIVKQITFIENKPLKTPKRKVLPKNNNVGDLIEFNQ